MSVSDIVPNSDSIFGFCLSGSVSVSPSCTYGPKRPLFAYTGSPVAGSVPIGSSPFGAFSSSTARSTVSSSRATSSGSDAVSSPRFTYGPYLPLRTTIGSPLSSTPIGMALIAAGSACSSACAHSVFTPGVPLPNQNLPSHGSRCS